MNKEKIKTFGVGFLLIGILFGGSYIWRMKRDNDIKEHSKYAIGIITRKTGSLKSGEQWHYQFKYNGVIYESYRSTHVDYNVNLGDYFLVNFSSRNPNHCKIYYEYKLDSSKLKYLNNTWDTIPYKIVYNSCKK